MNADLAYQFDDSYDEQIKSNANKQKASTSVKANIVQKINHEVSDIAVEIDTFKNKVGSSDENQLKKILNDLEIKWGIRNKIDYQKTLSTAIRNFKLDGDSMTMDKIEIGYKHCLYEIISIHLRFSKENLFDDDEHDYRSIFNSIFETISYSEKLVRSLLRIKLANMMEMITDTNDIGLSRFSVIDYEKNSPFQNLLLYLLDYAYDHNYMRYGGDVYEQIYSPQGYSTCAWKPCMSIEELVMTATKKEVSYEQWHNMTSAKGNREQAIEYMKCCKDPQFKDLVKDRHVFAFRNGIYIANADDSKQDLYDYFYEFDSNEPFYLPNDIVASKYFDLDFNNHLECKNWSEIPTPFLESIMNYQEFPEGVKQWMYILLGRLIYEVNELDQWQVMPFLKGQAGTGKSTITGKIAKAFYEYMDVGMLSNNSEKTFGLSSFYNKLLFIAPEIKNDIKVDQAEMQGIISGEDVVVAEKFKTAHMVEWKVPGMIAGNEVPGWIDNAGSISRRIIVFQFDKKVAQDKSDTKLGDKLFRELPSIIKKCNSAYLSAVKAFGNDDIWAHLPKYFKEQKQSLQEQSNALQSFLSSESVRLGEDVYCMEKTFVDAFNDYCRDHHYPKHKWNSDFYLGPFSQVKVKVEKKKRRKVGDKSVNGTFIMGLEIVTPDDGYDSNDPES
tara:strand:- start:1077 stop:3080 length:2004 start_codon:yes stop_codon:yes gene_type:complete